jgi:ABC-2 type transport system permease protein
MINIPVITRRELNCFFLSPVAYVVLTGLALAQGIMFALVLQPPIDPAWTAGYVFGVPVYLLIVAAPVLTMRLLSEETASGTIEVMMTAPVTEAELVLGKFGGVLVFAMVMFLPLAAEMGFLGLHGRMDVGPVLAGFMGLFLLTAQLLAIGLFCSALTRVQVAAAIMTFVALLALFSAWFLARDSSAVLPRLLRYLSPPGHYTSFPLGIVDTRDVAYFVITIALFLALTVRALQLRKWR